MRVITDLDEARRTILARRPPEEATLPPRMREGVRRIFGADLSAAEVVGRILADVRREGDAALLRYTEALDGARLENLLVTEDEIAAGLARTAPEVVAALRTAAAEIEAFHRRQLRQSWLAFEAHGTLGQAIRPLARVGLYAPGGSAVYPSSLLMSAILARVAGSRRSSSPRRRGATARPPAILAAAHVAGVHTIVKAGGAQAIGALAYGTASVPRVDKILGPGNIFVTLAKERVFGLVDIDALQGPTETLLVADDAANPGLAAADLLAQAEHDPMASAILLTPSAALAARAPRHRGAIARPLPPRRDRRLAGRERRHRRRAGPRDRDRAWRTPTPLSTSACWCATRWPWSAWSATPEASSSARPAPRSWATTSPAPATSCRLPAPRASPPSTSRSSSKSSA